MKKTVVLFHLLMVYSIIWAANPGAPTNLRVCDKMSPVGTENRPYFGWYFNDADDNEVQKAYQIILATSKTILNENKGDVWDSKKVEGGSQNYIYYSGTFLKPATQYFWKVRTWDMNGQVGEYSKVQSFVTGLFELKDWQGSKWIKRQTNENDDYTYFRKVFKVEGKEVSKAFVFVSASSNYELFLNEKFIGKGPAFHYPQYQYYNGFDITEALQNEKEAVFASMAHWYGGGQGRPKSTRGFLLKAVIEYRDGSQIVIGTDNTWKQTKAKYFTSGQPRRNGEGIGYIDKLNANFYSDEWKNLEFDDTKWELAVEIGEMPVEPWNKIMQADLTRLIETEIEPVSVKGLGNGNFVIDFGKIYPGIPVVTVKGGKKDSVVNLLGGFVLNADGSVSTKLNQSTNMSYSLVLNGKKSVFKPKVYLGMRYLQISGITGDMVLESVKFIERHYELDPTKSTFESSNKILNQVWHLMKHSLIVGSQESFVDTPTREKGGFLGDSWAQGVPAISVMGDRVMNLRILLEFLDSQDQYWPDGRLNAVYPNGDGGRDIPDYTQMYLVWAWDYYMQTGNVEFLKQNYAKLKKVAEYVLSHIDERTGLVHNLSGGSGPYQYGIIDWPSEMRYGYDMETVARTVINQYAYIDFAIISKIASVTGNNSDMEFYRKQANTIKRNINTKLTGPDGLYIDGLKGDLSKSTHASQHSNAFALAMDMVPESSIKKVANLVKERKMNMGMVALRWLPEALGQADEGAHMIDLYTNPNWDGWAQTLERGGTVTWEAWDAMDNTNNYSLSHPWGAVGLLAMQEYILGVKPLKPQHEVVQIKPLDFENKLEFAKGSLPTDRGTIEVEWNRIGKEYTMRLMIPDNIKAQVYVPILGKVGNKASINGETVEATPNGNYLKLPEIGSGEHLIER